MPVEYIVRRHAFGLLTLLFVTGCAAGGGSRSVPPAIAPAAGSPSAFEVPAKLSLPVPPPPPAMTPAKPPAGGRRAASAAGQHAAFFAGEAALSNGVYYLGLPNGNVFGYYSYLPDPNYIYHFDLSYQYVYDPNDGTGGIYLYDFASAHWWYTGRNYPFPYMYDFSLNALIYYYPDTANAGHYTSTPRYFYDFGRKKVITLPELAAGPGTAQNVYVVDYDPNANAGGPINIDVFAGSATGAVIPSRTIASGNGEHNDIVVAADGSFFGCGQLYPANSTRVVGCGAVAHDKNNGHFYQASCCEIAEYGADGKRLRAITLTNAFIREQAMAVDSGGNLFVGDSGTHQIDVYPPGATAPSRHLGNVQGSPIYYPYALGIDSHDNLYDVDNGSVYMFAPGSNGATASGGLSGSGGGAISLAIDEKDDVYVGNLGAQGGQGPSIEVFPPPNAQNRQTSRLDLTGVVKVPIAIAIGP